MRRYDAHRVLSEEGSSRRQRIKMFPQCEREESQSAARDFASMCAEEGESESLSRARRRCSGHSARGVTGGCGSCLFRSALSRMPLGLNDAEMMSRMKKKKATTRRMRRHPMVVLFCYDERPPQKEMANAM